MEKLEKKEEQKRGAPEYMNTYGDMITLCLTFFVLLYSMSTLDVDKFKALVNSYSGRVSVIQGGIGVMTGQGPSVLEQLPQAEKISEIKATDTQDAHAPEVDPADIEALAEMEARAAEMSRMESDFKTYLSENMASSGISVNNAGDYILVDIEGNLLFDSGLALLKPEGKEALDIIADLLLQYPQHEIRVEGHTDNVPQNPNNAFPTNRHLSSARADTVVIYLEEKGIDPYYLTSEGKGEYYPKNGNTNSTPEERAANRRVEIKSMAKSPNTPQSYPWDQKAPPES